MKHCPECGEKLPQPNPKHCPECGTTLISDAKETASSKTSKEVKTSKDGPTTKSAKETSPTKETAAGKGAKDATLLQNILSRKYLIIGVILVLLVGFFLAGIVNSASQDWAKPIQEKQQKQMLDAVEKHKEDLQRQQIAIDSAKAAVLENALKQFMSAITYDTVQISQTMIEYEPNKTISELNLPKKAAAAEKYAAQVNELISNIEGMKAYYKDHLFEINQLSTSTPQNETAFDQQMDATEAIFKTSEKKMADELEKFANSVSYLKADRTKVIANALTLLREQEGSS